MTLEVRVPEVLGMMMLADEEAASGRRRITRESERECDFHRRAVRPLALAREVEHVEPGNARCLEGRGILSCIRTLSDQHGESFARSDVIAVEGTEGKETAAMRRNLVGLADLQQLDEGGGKLHDQIMRAPIVT